MHALYDLDKLAREAGISPDQLRRLAECVRRLYGSDDMLTELRMFRTLCALRDGKVAFDDAIWEFQASEGVLHLDEYLTQQHIADDERAQIREEISRMSAPERLVVILYYSERLTFAQIAPVLNTSERQVQRLHAALLERLRAKFGRSLASRAFRPAS